MKENPIVEKSFDFAIHVVNLYKHLCTEKKEYILSKQLVRSGTSIGANVAEAQRAQSKADFIAKMSIALKEANETEYWLRLLYHTEYLPKHTFEMMRQEVGELIGLLMSICKTSNENR